MPQGLEWSGTICRPFRTRRLPAMVTGLEIGEEALSLKGERIWNLTLAIMVREGIMRRAEDVLEESFYRTEGGLFKGRTRGAETWLRRRFR